MEPSDSSRLEALVGEYVDRLRSGERIDPVDILAEHPDLGEEVVRELHAFLDLCGPEGTEERPLGKLGDFTLRRQLGRGGMGVVYEAWEGSMDRRVALKVLPAAVAVDPR